MRCKRQMLLVLAIALLATGRPYESSGAGKVGQDPDKPDNVEIPAVYVARVLSATAGRDAFVACLRQKELPVYAALRRINPQSGGAAGVFGRLAAIRTKAREDVARQLPELAVR